MATAQDTFTSIGEYKRSIDACIARCRNEPYPSADRNAKLARLNDDAAAAHARAAKIFNDDLAREERVVVERIGARVQPLQQQIADQNTVREDDTAKHQLAVAELQAKIGALGRQGPQTNSERAQLQSEIGQLQQEWQEKHNASNAVLTALQAELRAVQREQKIAQNAVSAALAERRKEPATDELLAIDAEMRQLVDRAGELEREIKSGVGATLASEAKAAFSKKDELFAKAEEYHQGKATLMFWAALSCLCLALVSVYVLFLRVESMPAPGYPASGSILERVLLVATGRIAIVFLFFVVLKKLSDLHRSHIEQAIVYRDRRAALGVADVLFEATPEIQQRRDLLTRLADVYLDFDENAFGLGKRASASSTHSFEDQLSRVKQTVDAIRPAVSLAQDIAGRSQKPT